MNTNKQTGQEYEKTAATLLKKAGYKILTTNYLTRMGEIDIIASKEDYIVFIEVKYRKSASFGAAPEFVSKSKQAKIIKSALAYIKKHYLHDKSFRFDVVAITGSETEIIENAYAVETGKYYI
ncbi:MAG: YraN family protein [Elusimicrobia bacterium]|nr:YraN family protein [Elusimicrobiota bacterium]